MDPATTIVLVKLITDLIISLSTTLQRIDQMSEEEKKVAIEEAEKLSAVLQQRQDQH